MAQLKRSQGGGAPFYHVLVLFYRLNDPPYGEEQSALLNPPIQILISLYKTITQHNDV